MKTAKTKKYKEWTKEEKMAFIADYKKYGLSETSRMKSMPIGSTRGYAIKVCEEFGINKEDVGIKKNVVLSEEAMLQYINDAKELNKYDFYKKWGKSKNRYAVANYSKKLGIPCPFATCRNTWTKEMRKKLLDDYKESGLEYTAKARNFSLVKTLGYIYESSKKLNEPVEVVEAEEVYVEELKQYLTDCKELGRQSANKKWDLAQNTSRFVRSFAVNKGLVEYTAFRHRFTDAEKRQFVQDYKKYGRKKTIQIWNFPDTCDITNYVRRFAEQLNISSDEAGIKQYAKKEKYTEEEMRQFIKDYVNLGYKETGRKWNVSANAVTYNVRKFAQKLGIPEESLAIKARKKWTVEEKEKLLRDCDATR